MKKKNTILITGATGFLGSSIINSLSKQNYNFLYLIRENSNLFRIKKHKKNKKIIIDYQKLESVFKKNEIKCILHCATSYGTKDRNIANIIQSNLFLPLKLLDYAKKYNVKTFINTDTILKKNISHYTLSKHQFNEWFKKFSKDIYCCNIKIEHFFGPGDDKSKFVISLINDILEENYPVKLTKGVQKRDFIYIDEVVSAITKIIEHSEKKTFGIDTYEIGTGNSMSIKKFAETIAQLCGKNPKKIFKFGSVPFRKNEAMDIKINIKKLKKIGWYPRSNLKRELVKTINYFKNEKINKNL
jgi:CDP-paratose synthetase